MNTKTIGFGLLALFASATAVSGCTSDSNANIGTLKQQWTIAGSKNPAFCEKQGAAQMRLVVVDQQNVVRSTQYASCSVFQTEIRLQQSTYSAAATFLDINGTAVSRTVIINPFVINEDEDTKQEITFLLSDFNVR